MTGLIPAPYMAIAPAGASSVRQLRLTLRASTGACIALQLMPGRCDVLPTTAYLLLGDRCRRTCAFCAQSSLSTCSAGMLSRVSWPEVDLARLLCRLSLLNPASPTSAPTSTPGDDGLAPKRICIQVTDCDGAMEDLDILVPRLKSSARIPVSVSFKPRSPADIGRLFSVGVDRLGIAIDAADPHIYEEVKGGSFGSAKEYLVSAASRYPGRISTHVIAGLGETEESVIRLLAESIETGITVGLFAFTPVKGTPMESRRQPDIGSYRRIQVASHLLRLGLVPSDGFRFEGGRIRSIDIEPEQAIRVLQSGKAFETSGCEDCNRPYYNERPGSVMYNYPRPLVAAEVEEAIESTGLWRIDRS